MSQLISKALRQNINLHVIKDNKFKTNLIKVYFQRPLTNSEVTDNALIPMILKRGSTQYQTAKDISIKLEELYGSYLDTNIFKKGERQIIEFTLGTPDLRYIEDKNLLREAVKLLNGILSQPLLENDGFKGQYIEQEVSNLTNRIQARINDKNKYAMERCIEEMSQKEAFGLYELGNLADLKKVDSHRLYQQYLQIINNSPIDIVAVGDLDPAELTLMFGEELALGKGTAPAISRETIEFHPTEVKNIHEKLDVNQGKLTIGYRTNIPFEDEKYPAAMVYSNLLGGGAHSRLFIKVREEKSLCYYIYTRLEKFKSIMLISCGIEKKQYDETLRVIDQQMEAIVNGEITDEELESTKKAMINSVNSMGDNQNALADYYYSQIIGNQIIMPDEMIERIKAVTKEAIRNVARMVEKDTIYFLSN